MKVPLSINIRITYSPEYPFINDKVDMYINEITKKMTKKLEKYIRRAVKRWKKQS